MALLNKNIIIQTLANNKTEIKKPGVSKLGLFGSYLSGAQNDKSDIDVYVEFDVEKENFDNFINLCFLLDNLFDKKKVAVITKGSISPYIEPKILSTVEYVSISD